MDPWPPSRRVVHAYAFFFTLPELHPFCLALAGSTSGSFLRRPQDYLWCHEVVGGKRPLQTSGRCRANKCELCKEKNFGRSDIADNWLVTRHFCFKCVQKCAHADSGKSLSGARHGKGECTPSGYVNSVPSRSTSPLTVGRRCICRLQDEHCAAPAFSGFEWETFACFPHLLCTEGLAYLKTAAVRKNLKEPANGNACVSAWWANAAFERLRTRQRYSIEEIRAELPPSHT